MLINENTAISTSGILLVPYEPRHVPLYHTWMSDPAILAATASEPLSLDQELSNQLSWRSSPDKLTFIIANAPIPADIGSVTAGLEDANQKLLGDVNLFLTQQVLDQDSENDEPVTAPGSGCCSAAHRHSHADEEKLYSAEIDIMLAAQESRGKGLGTEAVKALLQYVAYHEQDIIREAAKTTVGRIISVEARIKQDNHESRSLFSKLGFVQRGAAVNYFGEVKLVNDWQWKEIKVEGWRELPYKRDDLDK